MNQFADVVARTIYGEARGELYGGRIAVGCVIRNRVQFDLWNDKKPDWWGEGYEEVCKKPWQFSCWNKNDPNYALLIVAGPGDPVFLECLAVAERIIENQLADITLGSTHYHAVGHMPQWAQGKQPVIQIGKHYFYNEVEQ